VSTGRKKEGMLFFGIESAAALIVSLFINVCVVSVFAKGFYGKGIENIGLENAGNFLGETFGTSMVRHAITSCAAAFGSGWKQVGRRICCCAHLVDACITEGCVALGGGNVGPICCASCVAQKYVWALGLLAAGQSSTMTGTYTGQFVMSGFLDLKVRSSGHTTCQIANWWLSL